MSAPDPNQPCARAARCLAAGDLAGWRGLPPACRPEELAAAVGPLLEGEGRGRLGRGEALFRATADAGGLRRLRLWLEEDGSVALVDAEVGGTPPPSGLDEPEARLDYRWRTLAVEAGEWVWPERGLALFLSDGGDVVHAAGFVATTLEDYLERLRPHLGERRLPGGRR